MDSHEKDDDQDVCFCVECWDNGNEQAFLKVEELNLPMQINLTEKNFYGLGERNTEHAELLLDALMEEYGEDLSYIVGIALRRSYYAEYRHTEMIDVSPLADRYSPHVEDTVSKKFRSRTPVSKEIPEIALLNALGVYLLSVAAEFQAEGNTQSAFDVVFQADFLLGLSRTHEHIDRLNEVIKTDKKESLSAAGSYGGKARGDRYEPVKQWALGKARDMHGAHKQVARQLAESLPSNLVGISDAPERLIYDTLRATLKQ